MRWLSDLAGTGRSQFWLGKAKFDASGLTQQRDYMLPDFSGDIVISSLLRPVNGRSLIGTTGLDITSVAINATELGVIAGDPDAAADNSETIQSALDEGVSLYFPAGLYYIAFAAISLPAKSCIYGDGASVSVLSWVEEDSPVRGNMFEAAGDIDSLVVRGVGFVGNRTHQITPTVSGHDLACFHLRSGSVRNIDFDGVCLSDFGDGVSTGGGILIGALSGTGHVIENIRIANSEFAGISNVPGVYINGATPYHVAVKDITVTSCVFTASVSAHQNAIYILGGSAVPATCVQVTHNRLHINATIDTCVELNYVTNYVLDGNQVICYGDASCVGLLVREGAQYGSISHNTLVNLGTGNANTDGISVVQLSVASQVGVVIDHNVILGWGCGGAGGGINAGAGTVGLTVTNNHIHGRGNGPSTRTAVAIRLASVSRLRVSGNYIQNATYAAVLGPINGGTIENNTCFNVGDGAVGVIVEVVANQAIVNLIIRQNHVIQAIASTPNFVSVSPAAVTGNRVDNNNIPAGMNPVNTSMLAKWSAIITPAASGALLAGRVYSFIQGSISMADGDGYTIGENLDATLDGYSPLEVVVGDTVLVAPPGDISGALCSAYVQTTNRIRIRVQNLTGAGIDVPAGAWRVTVVKTSAM